VYRFPLPNCKLAEIQFTLTADAAECREPRFQPASAKKEEGGSRLGYSYTWKDQGPGDAVQFAFKPALPQVQAISGRQGESGPRYIYARVRPDLRAAAAEPFAQHAVFLLDTSLSEHPDRFGVNMMLLHKILESDPDIKQFNILTFNVAPAWVEPKGWLANTKQGREQAFRRLDGIVLEGATDISAALDKLAQPGFEVARGTPLQVFLLSDGQITWGEPDVNTLVARFEQRCSLSPRFYCYRTGLGAENLELFEALRFLPQKLLIVAGVKMNSLVPDFGNLVHRHVEEITVVGDQNEGVGIIRKILFQPIASFKIKMVGGLIQQE